MNAPIHRLIEARGAARPDARAVVFGDDALTYAQLDERANRLAHHLVARGVGPDVIVGVHMDRSLDLVVAMLAVMKAGGAYLPLDPNYPADRLAFMLDDTRAPVVITDRPLDVAFAGARVDLRADAAAIAREPATTVAREVDPANLAYIIYTSGSTGKPKGVLISHDRVTRLMSSTEAWFHFDEHDVWTFFHSYAFDFSVWEIWGALIYGGSVVIVPDEARKSPDDLLALLAKHRVTVLNQIPSAFRHLIAAATRTPTTTPLALRYVIFGGEALELRSLVPWFERYPQQPKLVNMYGITETTVHVTYRVIEPAECRDPKGSPIGVAIPDLELHVLDAALRPVADGAEGEIYVGGAGLARGYHARPSLTAERFVPDPFSGRVGARLYKTGDLARRLADGSFEYLGRNDHQVKIRGHRIETGEIGSILATHPGVREAVVVARDVGEDDRRLVAYVSLKTPTDSEALREFLGARLPSYMVPSAFVVVDALPITPSGKIDTKALPAPDWSAQATRAEYAAPVTEDERILAAVWSSLLGVERIGRDDRFFELGGHSLLAAQVASRLAVDYGTSVPVRLFLTSPSLTEAAAAFGEARVRQGGKAREARRIPARPDVERAPIAFAQESIWVHDQVMQDVLRRTRGYVECPVLQLRGRVAVPLLERALNEIAARHEVWRTSFVLEDEPMQLIGRSARIPIKLYDRRAAPEEHRRGELEAVAEALAAQPFVIARAPLVRAALVTFSDDEHALLLAMHHLITDAWSENLIATELARLYGFLAAGDSLPPRTEVEVQYADYAAWERSADHDRAREETRAFWRAQFATPPDPLALPRVTAPSSTRAVRLSRPLGAEQSQRLAVFCRQHNLSPSAVLYAAFADALAEHATGGRFVLGVANANRTELSEKLPGCFTGVLPIVVDVADRAGFVTSAQRLLAAVAEAVPHGSLPLPEIARLVGRSKAPLVQVQASTQLASTVHTAGGIAFHQDYVPVNDAKFALEMVVQEQADRSFTLAWVADPTQFGADELRAFAEGVEAALAAGLAAPHGQRAALAPRTGVRAGTIHRIIEAQAAARPTARAVVLGDDALTYAQLNERANRLAHHLVARGVGPDVIVGVHMDRSLDLVVAMLAVMKAGGAYLPLDPNYPADRLAFMVADCRAPVVITDRPLDASLPGIRVDVRADAAAIAREPATNVAREVDPANLAYIIYTSGSTGKPKGVLISHDRVTRLMWSTEAWFHFDEHDVWTFFHSYAFDFSVWEIWGALIYGGSVVVVPDEARKSPDDLLAVLAKHRVTVLNQIPSAFRHLIAAATRTPTTTPLALRYVIFGGEALELRSLVPWFERYPQQPKLVNMYGITETTVHVTYRVIEPAECRDPKGSPIGLPIPDLELHVLDASLRPVADGAEGEIYVGGAGLARGYHARPSLSAERFVPDPFSGRIGARLYKTGDLARRLPDGSFEYLGRNDHQVKIRGHRIETGEIGSILATHPGVREAVVVARDVGEDDRRLVAYVSLKAPTATDALRDFLAARLPAYMVPSAFVVVDALPITPSGKIDTKALPAPDWSVQVTAPAAEESRTPEQVTIAKLWCEVLKVREVGLRDDFFELGGHSLLAIRLMSKLRAALEVEIPLGQFFAAPTVEGLAAEVTKLRGGGPAAAILPAPRDQPLPLSNAQERVWFVEQMMRPDSPRPFNVALAISIQGELDRDVLARCLTEVVARHEAWRTNFRFVDRKLVQVIGAPFTVELGVIQADAARRAEQVQLHAREQARAPFDLAKGRLVRANLLAFAPQDHVLLLTVHHIVYDGGSVPVLVGELAALYDAFRAGKPSPLAPLRAQFADIAHWQRTSQSDAETARQLAYWRDQLAAAPRVDLPTDFPRPREQTHLGAHVDARIPHALTTSAKALAQREGVTLFATLVAAFAVQLARKLGQPDLVIGTVVSTRTRPELETALGLLLNTVALRLRLDGDPSFRDVLHHAADVIRDAFRHQDVPYERVTAELRHKHDTQRGPLHQVTVTVNAVPPAPAPQGQIWGIEFPDTGSVVDDLSLQFFETDRDLLASYEYRTDLFEQATIEKLAREFESVLGLLVASPDRPLSDALERDGAAASALAWSALRNGATQSSGTQLVDAPTAMFDARDVSGEPATARALLSRDVTALLRQHARRLGVEVVSLCHLAWASVIAKSSAHDRVVFGTKVFGRAPSTGALFQATVPLQLDVGDASVEEAARTVHAALVDVAGQAQPNATSGELHAILDYRWRAPGAEPRAQVAPFELAIDESGDDVWVTAIVAAKIAPERICAYVACALERLASALDRAPTTPWRSLDVVPAEERSLLLETWNRTAAPYPSERCIHELFDEQVRQRPTAIAVEQDDVVLTYAELNARANRLAHQLIERGVRPDSRVALCAERSPAMVVGLLAILKAGGAYVPLDPHYPQARVAEVVREAAPVLALVDAAGRAAVADASVPVLALDAAGGSEHAPQVPSLTSAHAAYVLYTSGSTGKPKGVVVEHRAMVNHIHWQVHAFGFTETDAVLQRTSISFDASGWELWTPLAIGARLVLLPAGAERDLERIPAAIARHRVTIVQFVPSLLRLLVESKKAAPLACDFIFCGGEALDATLVARARDCARRAFVNLYGPTETTIDAVAWTCPAGETPSVIPIGRPIANTAVYVLDAAGQPVPLGAIGELYIGGAGVARGYLHQPELTAQRFVRDPFSSRPDARMYRTGDLVRYLPGGELEFLGRNDDQVKLRGYRIELGEIEARLLAHRDVHEAAVVVRDDAAGGKRLVAYVTVHGSPSAELATTLRQHLAEQLPAYMVPAAFVRLEAMPRMPNGKLDRRQLPADEAPAATDAPTGAGEDAFVGKLAGVFAEILEVPSVGPDDNFFELGGHSMLAAHLVAQVEEVFGIELSLRSVFEAPTPRGLAALAAAPSNSSGRPA